MEQSNERLRRLHGLHYFHNIYWRLRGQRHKAVKAITNHMNKTMTTSDLFKTHNAKLISNLIPKGDEPIYARSWIDPNCEDFNQPLNK